jgi:hypothetical protein
MQQLVTIVATMQDGTVIVEHTGDFGEFVGLALGFRRDPDCVRLVWRVEPVPPPPLPPAAAARPRLVLLPAC